MDWKFRHEGNCLASCTYQCFPAEGVGNGEVGDYPRELNNFKKIPRVYPPPPQTITPPPPHKGKTLIGASCLCSVSMPIAAEQLPRVIEFSVRNNNHYGFFFLHTLPSTISFIKAWIYVIVCENISICCQELLGLALSKLLAENNAKMSKRYHDSWCHAWELRVFPTLPPRPPLKQLFFLAPVCHMEIPVCISESG